MLEIYLKLIKSSKLFKGKTPGAANHLSSSILNNIFPWDNAFHGLLSIAPCLLPGRRGVRWLGSTSYTHLLFVPTAATSVASHHPAGVGQRGAALWGSTSQHQPPTSHPTATHRRSGRTGLLAADPSSGLPPSPPLSCLSTFLTKIRMFHLVQRHIRLDQNVSGNNFCMKMFLHSHLCISQF